MYKTYKFSHNFLSSANLVIYCILYISCSPPHWDSFKLYFLILLEKKKRKVSRISLFESSSLLHEQQLEKRKFFTSEWDIVTLYKNCSRGVKDEWEKRQTTAVKKFLLSWCDFAYLYYDIIHSLAMCILKREEITEYGK